MIGLKNWSLTGYMGYGTLQELYVSKTSTCCRRLISIFLCLEAAVMLSRIVHDAHLTSH